MHVMPSLAGWIRPLAGLDSYNKANVEAAKTKTLSELDYLEKALATRTFLVGDRVSIADLFVVSALLRGFEFVS